MSKYSLTKQGEDFIISACGKGTSKLSGKLNIPLPNCIPITPSDKIWTSNPLNNGGVTTNEQLAKKLIEWYNKYSEIYQVDANIVAAQGCAESGYIVWTYATTTTASSLSQFTSDTVFDIIIQNTNKNIEKFTDEEIGKITKGLSGNFLNDKNDIRWSTDAGKRNRPIIHQNMIDNPELMVKAHCRYYRVIANYLHSNITACILAGYFQGPYKYVEKTYGNTISNFASINKSDEVINYVYKIFNMLGNKENSTMRGHYFGYDQLGMTSPPTADSFNTNLG